MSPARSSPSRLRWVATVAALTLALTLALGLLAVGFVGPARVRGPDVVLLTVDTLRADYVGALNPNSPAKTPHIDALAKDGVVYTQAFSPISVTGPAFASLHTGQEPGTHGVVMNLFRGSGALSPDTITLAQRLAEHHYRTGAFISGFTLRRALGLSRGFQRYDTPPANQRRRPGDQTARAALRWMAAQPWFQRMFLWWHSYDVHGPLTPYDDAAELPGHWVRNPAQLDHIPAYQLIDGVTDPRFYARRYAAGVSFADVQVGRILDRLREEGRYDEALIVFVADHGESLDERELWFDHGTHASAEQLQVPLIIKYPEGLHAGERVDALVDLVDVAPTILDVLGYGALPRADGAALGARQRTLVLGESSHCKNDAILDCSPKGAAGKEFSVRSASHSLVRRSTASGVVLEAYDRVHDPRELHPLAVGSQPSDADWSHTMDEMAKARAALKLKSVAPAKNALGSPADRAELNALRALGYVDDPQSPPEQAADEQ